MAGNEKFLNLYKSYEGLLRDHGKEYREAEEAADDLTQNRMRITRQMRNYLSHNADPMFLQISDQQIKLLEKLIGEERQSGDILQRHLYTPKRAACEEGCLLGEAVLKMAKQKTEYMPVYGKDGLLGVLDLYKLIPAWTASPEGRLAKHSYGAYDRKKLLCKTPETSIDALQPLKEVEMIVCCTSNGMPDGKFLGVWKKDG